MVAIPADLMYQLLSEKEGISIEELNNTENLFLT